MAEPGPSFAVVDADRPVSPPSPRGLTDWEADAPFGPRRAQRASGASRAIAWLASPIT